jgi:hypothetical protein
MPCNAIATISAKISNETFNKIKFTQAVKLALNKFFDANGLDSSKLEKTDVGYSYYNQGTYIVVESSKLSVTSTALNKDDERDLTNKLAKYINTVTNVVLRQYIRRVAENKGYKIVNEEITPQGIISLVIEKI